MLVPWIGQHAGFVLAKDLITVAGNKVIQPVSNRPRDDPSQPRNIPNAAKRFCEQEECICLCEQSLVGLSMIENGIDGVEIPMVHAMPLQQRCGKVALQRSKPKPVMPISFQQKLNGAIAKTADSIVKDNWVGRRLMHGSTSSRAA
jgi:hypothetical protein